MADAPPALRILHVLAPAVFGGLEQVVRALSTGQRDRGHAVRLLAIVDQGREADHPLVAELRAAEMDVSVVPVAARAYTDERRAVRDALATFRPHVVHTHGARVDVLDAPVARRAGFPTVTTVHGFTGGGWKNRLYELMQRRAMRRMDAVVAVSAPLRRRMVDSGVRADRVHTVPNAWAGTAAIMPRNEARTFLNIGEIGVPVVGWVGRLTHEKGADVFLEAIALLKDIALHAVVVGSGQDRELLERLTERLDIRDRIRWVGTIERAGRVLSAFDLFVMSSRTEGTPIVLFEAMAAGAPVVTTAVGGIPDVVGSAEAILVVPDNAAALADAIRRSLADPAAARARSAAARERLDTRFALDPWLDQYDAIYRGIRR